MNGPQRVHLVALGEGGVIRQIRTLRRKECSVHLPKQFQETDQHVLLALMASHPLATWAAICHGEIEVNHIPFLIDPDRGPYGTLVGHLAKANRAWRECATDVDTIAVFQGPQAYITPSWYPSKADHGKVVPTWNYAVVHAHGKPRFIHDPQWLLQHVSDQSRYRERDRDPPWHVSDAPADFINSMVNAIVGIEIPIDRLEGKWKVSQNRGVRDRHGVAAGLRASEDAQADEMAALVAARIPSET